MPIKEYEILLVRTYHFLVKVLNTKELGATLSDYLTFNPVKFLYSSLILKAAVRSLASSTGL